MNPITSTILCDAEGCDKRLVIEDVLDQGQSVEVALRAGWHAQLGARGYHWCPRHSHWSRK